MQTHQVARQSDAVPVLANAVPESGTDHPSFAMIGVGRLGRRGRTAQLAGQGFAMRRSVNVAPSIMGRISSKPYISDMPVRDWASISSTVIVTGSPSHRTT